MHATENGMSMTKRFFQPWIFGIAYTLIAAFPAWAQPRPENTRHPLTNLIWDSRAQQPVTLSDLERRLQSTQYVLLGEVHDNGIHHRLRRDLIAALVRSGRRPAVAMEQFDREQQPAMDRAIAEAPRDPERLRVASGFNNLGWNWPDYAPIISLALEAGLPLLAANLSRDQAFRIATSNAAAVLGEQTADTLGLNKPMPPAAQRKLERVIDDGHCGKAPATIRPGMVAAQRARDAVMAQIVAKNADNGIVLIAGNGHVRRDFGVPLYLQDGTAPANILAVGFIEAQDRQLKPADYYDRADPEYDYIVFTERVAREDPCATLTFKPRQPMTQP
jgi:uncharacterized iron-regulated protein